MRTALALLLPILALTGCITPSAGMPDASVIGVAGGQAQPPDCARLREPPTLSYGGTALPSMAFGCATYTNLAAMVARPEDLTHPVPYGGPDAALAARAVRRYEEGKQIPLRNTRTTNAIGQ